MQLAPDSASQIQAPVPLGNAAKASLVAAKTVNVPGLSSVSTEAGGFDRGDQRGVVLRVDRVLDDVSVGYIGAPPTITFIARRPGWLPAARRCESERGEVIRESEILAFMVVLRFRSKPIVVMGASIGTKPVTEAPAASFRWRRKNRHR